MRDLTPYGIEVHSFDGAAFSRTRKPFALMGTLRRSTRAASMEPRSLERGNQQRNFETLLGSGLRGFNGAAFSRTRKPSRALSVKPRSEPYRFNGAAFSRTRKPNGREDRGGRSSASMEPRSLERGNVAPARGVAKPDWLQWSRVLSNAETSMN